MLYVGMMKRKFQIFLEELWIKPGLPLRRKRDQAQSLLEEFLREISKTRTSSKLTNTKILEIKGLLIEVLMFKNESLCQEKILQV